MAIATKYQHVDRLGTDRLSSGVGTSLVVVTV